jgi:hypothetical protein
MSAAGLAGAARAFAAGDANAAKSPNPLPGVWTYRSFKAIPDIATPFDKLEFWRATLTIAEAPALGEFKGKIEGGPGESLVLSGSVSYGTLLTARFQGLGDGAASKDWLYDYLGWLTPAWPNGVDQRPALVGTVVRTKPHKDGTGTALAGVVAQWIAVRRDG